MRVTKNMSGINQSPALAPERAPHFRAASLLAIVALPLLMELTPEWLNTISLSTLTRFSPPLTRLPVSDVDSVDVGAKTGTSLPVVPIREWLLANNNGSSQERGLRGWAHQIYASFTAGNS